MFHFIGIAKPKMREKKYSNALHVILYRPLSLYELSRTNQADI